MNMAEIRHRITSIQQTRQITQAMRLISSAKMRSGMQRAEINEQYVNEVRSSIRVLLASTTDVTHRYIRKARSGRAAYIVITSDRGLAGGYNANVLKLAHQHMQMYEPVHVYAIGNVAHDFFTAHDIAHDLRYLHAIVDPTLTTARKLTLELCELYDNDEIDQVFVFYTLLISSLNGQPMVMRLLPVRVTDFPDIPLPQEVHGNSFVFEPDAATVLENLVPQYLIGSIYATLIQSFASEQCARMAAMDNATRNADEMLASLRLEYNRVRQGSITQELNEIMGGMLTGDDPS